MAKKKQKKNNKKVLSSKINRGEFNRRGEPATRLSQCMIVKNEERNIEKALSWGHGIVYEQIVVDTGSDDRTVEIAEKMGAKVYHFEWINDFASAKNFAVEQAGGDWIAFLDADEYFPKNDAQKLLPILEQIKANPEMNAKCLGISCPMHQLGDNGKTMDINMQVRLFKNIPQVRYTGRIHEQLSIGAADIIRTQDIKIMHTGYSTSAYMQTDKSLRNIGMIRAELAEDPGNLRMKMYLADALTSHVNNSQFRIHNSQLGDKDLRISDEEDMQSDASPLRAYADEAEALYIEVAQADSGLDADYRKTAMRNLMGRYAGSSEIDTVYEDICERARNDFPDDHKIMCLYAAVLVKKGKYSEALGILQERGAQLLSSGSPAPVYSVSDLVLMYTQMVYAAQGLGDTEAMIKYMEAILIADKTRTDVLGNYIKMLLKQGVSYENVVEKLAAVYDISSPEDNAIITGTMNEYGFDK